MRNRTASTHLCRAALVLTVLASAGGRARGDEESVAVRVNGTPITDAMVREVVKSVLTGRPTPPDSDEIARLTDAARDSLIDLELLYQDAQARHITVSDQEVAAEIQRTRARFTNAAQFTAAMQRSGLSEAALRADTRKTLTVNRLLAEVVWKDIHIPPEAERRFYDENREALARGGAVPPFEQVQASIRQVLREEEQNRRQRAYVAELRAKARIETPGK